jgi:hypothetical protein
MFDNLSQHSSVNSQDGVATPNENDPFFTKGPEKPAPILAPKTEYFPDYD